MARPRSFDADVVLDKAGEAFRSKGYEATSVEYLERVTGLRRASLYGAFHDKHSLFLAALKRYAATSFEGVLSELATEYVGRPHSVRHDRCEARGGTTCEWVTQIVT